MALTMKEDERQERMRMLQNTVKTQSAERYIEENIKAILLNRLDKSL